jgi:ABC-type spermidine/putrescine transport system permease subunit II
MLFFLPITLPGLFLGIALLSLFDRMDFSLSLTTVGIAHMVYVFPYFLLIALTAVARLDPALEEVAADLGASPARTFWKITLPQIWPVLAGAAALAFMLSLDEFVITFFVIGTDSTLPLFLFSSLRRTVDPSINVISTLLISTLLLLWVVVFALTLREARLRQGRVLAERGAW